MINKRAPEFSAKAFHENRIKDINLNEYNGKWRILFFYPADFTFVCPTELVSLAKNHQRFKDMDAEILSISTDTEFVHMAWHNSSEQLKSIQFPMIADPSGVICRSYGTYIPEEGLSHRATFIIDPDGIIKSQEMNENSIGRSTEEIIRKLEALRFVRENKNQLCPMDWRPGSETIRLED